MGIKRIKVRAKQFGQSMVEYIVVLVFGVMVLLGPGGDMMLLLLQVINDKYQGYSYAVSLSTLPDHDSLGDYLIDSDIVDPIDPGDMLEEIGDFTNFPTLETFPPSDDDGISIPDSPGDFLDGFTSFF